MVHPIARWVSRRIPIVAVKAGRTEAGVRAAASHTAALSGGDVAVDALLKTGGSDPSPIDRGDARSRHNLELSKAVPGTPRGCADQWGRAGILAADACETNGLVVPKLTASTAARLRPLLPPEASVSNPVDMIASATAQQYGKAVRVLGAAPEIDALIVMFNTPCSLGLRTWRPRLSRLVPRSKGRAAAHRIHEPGGATVLSHETGIPSFAFPENAAAPSGGASNGRTDVLGAWPECSDPTSRPKLWAGW